MFAYILHTIFSQVWHASPQWVEGWFPVIYSFASPVIIALRHEAKAGERKWKLSLFTCRLPLSISFEEKIVILSACVRLTVSYASHCCQYHEMQCQTKSHLFCQFYITLTSPCGRTIQKSLKINSIHPTFPTLNIQSVKSFYIALKEMDIFKHVKLEYGSWRFKTSLIFF